ncbi:outer membrane protein insertion porin family [Methylohalomonas lacus]|uniref:Outer membrane protein assembly factor BamA n=1 Tax=Methylohalomonas lacus TaxID=398773 RepID=A0AAE3HII8_9GAMM|nr:outer membrane protein assembly factor BamA [Methylohalomonas lacus]MCS3902525.1 outer membrane protein insertion porin family [Methylohalomonas lacus]
MQTPIKQVLWFLLAFILFQNGIQAAEEFTIEDIRVEGLERITPGTVFNYLPVKVGDRFDDALSGQAVRSLFQTGFFNDVKLERDGNVLVVQLEERPAIGSIEVNGNEAIDSEDLMTGLRQVGFAEGRVFDQALLEQVQQELRRQYFSRGKYAVKINTDVTELNNNRVGITIDISEGRTARIKDINIVGNESFDTDDLLDEFNLTTETWFSFITSSDQYSRQKLGADLETLRSYYLDRGYVNFNVDSTQVSITPDKKDIYITINISEGEQHKINEIKLAGELILPKEELVEQITIYRDDIFSRKEITATSENLTDALGDEGYAFANVNAIPDIDKENKVVDLTFFIDPGKRVYVRRINFSGNQKTRDEVLRREMRQQEGGWVSTKQVERGRVRLQRLGYFRTVNVETPAVPGTVDQVDVNYEVEEMPSGNLMAGIGFSQNQGLIFQTSVTQDNFLGSGKRISFSFNNSEVNRRFGFGYTNPYYTIDGISRGFNAFYQETDAFQANLTQYDSTIWGGSVNFGIPISEFNTLNFDFGYENTEIETNQRLGSSIVTDFLEGNEGRFDIWRAGTSFTYDSRNKAILPDSGTLQRIRAEVSVPLIGESLEFYKLDYRSEYFFPLIEDYILNISTQVGYGDGYGGTEELPFFENFFAGGPRSVRGYEENTLGPKDVTSFGRNRPIGGKLKLVAGAEVILPVPFFKDNESVRISGFFDAGNVYGPNPNDPNYDPDNPSYDVKLSELRYSTGLSGIWISPFGVVSVSLAVPIGDKEGDDTQPFQFTFGTSF